MTTTLITLLFVGAAAFAAASMTITWRQYRVRIAANLAAVHSVGLERSFFVRIVPAAMDPAQPVQRALRRRARRQARRQTLRPAPGLRAAA